MKKIKIETSWLEREEDRVLQLTISNNGTEPVGVQAYGYKKWNGEIVDGLYVNVDPNYPLEPEQDPLELFFVDPSTNIAIEVNEEEIYYYYVRSNGGVEFRHYTIPRIKALIRYLLG